MPSGRALTLRPGEKLETAWWWRSPPSGRPDVRVLMPFMRLQARSARTLNAYRVPRCRCRRDRRDQRGSASFDKLYIAGNNDCGKGELALKLGDRLRSNALAFNFGVIEHPGAAIECADARSEQQRSAFDDPRGFAGNRPVSLQSSDVASFNPVRVGHEVGNTYVANHLVARAATPGDHLPIAS